MPHHPSIPEAAIGKVTASDEEVGRRRRRVLVPLELVHGDDALDDQRREPVDEDRGEQPEEDIITSSDACDILAINRDTTRFEASDDDLKHK